MNKDYLKIFLQRIISSVVVLFLVISFVFIIMHVSPGDPAQKYLSPKLSPKLYSEVSNLYKLDKSIAEQYLSFIKNIFSGNLGVSYNYREPVTSVIFSAFEFTIFFATLSFLLQIFISSFLVYWIVKMNLKKIESFFTKFNLFVYSIPIFSLSLFLIYLFSYQLNLFPSSGLKSVGFYELGTLQQLGDYLSHLILPLIASVLAGIPLFYKYLLDEVKNNLDKPYVKNLKLIGLSERSILLKHVFPNSVNTVIAIAGVEYGLLLSGSVINETIFALPGMGRLTMNAVITRDYPVIIGAVLLSSVVVIITNLIADLIRVFRDKRLFKGLMS